MSVRRLYLDGGCGERRAVVTLDGRPERLMIERDGDPPGQELGARLIGRVSSLNRAQNLAFLDLGPAVTAVLDFDPVRERLVEGAAVEVEIRAQARRDKAAVARLLGPGEGPPRLLAAGPSLEQRLSALAGGVQIVTGAIARTVADTAQDEALQTLHPLAGGASIAVETTRALTAVDVDLGPGGGRDAKRAARAANLAALAAAARVLRLKGLGGLVAIDLVGRGHDAPALMSAARGAFAPDNPGVAFAPVSRFGVLELTIPRRARPALDILADEAGRATALTLALGVVRALEREAAADPGGRFEVLADAEVARAAGAALDLLRQRIGGRVAIAVDPGRGRDGFVVTRL